MAAIGEVILTGEKFMKKLIFFFILAICLFGCSGKPSEREVRNIFLEAVGQPFDSIVSIDNFSRTNGLLKDDHTYIADVTYDMIFKCNNQCVKDFYTKILSGGQKE